MVDSQNLALVHAQPKGENSTWGGNLVVGDKEN